MRRADDGPRWETCLSYRGFGSRRNIKLIGYLCKSAQRLDGPQVEDLLKRTAQKEGRERRCSAQCELSQREARRLRRQWAAKVFAEGCVYAIRNIQRCKCLITSPIQSHANIEAAADTIHAAGWRER